MNELLLKVRCPRCGYEQPTKTLKRVKCWNCGHTYKVYYKIRFGKAWTWRSRIVEILQGSKAQLLKEFEKLRKGEKDEN